MKSSKIQINFIDMLKKYKWRLIVQAIIFGILMIIVMVWEPFLLKIIFYVMETKQLDLFFILFLSVSFVLMLLFVIGYFNNTYLDMDRWKLMNQECKEALQELPRLSYDDMNHYFTKGGIFERIFSLGQAKLGAFFNIVIIIINVMAMLLLVFNLTSAGLGLVILSIIMISIQLFIMKMRSIKMVQYENKIRTADEDSNTYANHIMNDLPFIIMNQLEDDETTEYIKTRNKVFTLMMFQNIWEGLFENIEMYIVIIMKLVLAIWMLPLMLGSGVVTAIFTTIDKMKIIFSTIAEKYIGTKQVIVAVERYDEMLQYQTKNPEDTLEEEQVINIADATIDIGDKVIFHNITLEIKKGEKVAIIGYNGCGKSTVLKVMAGLYQLTGGRLLRKKECSIAYIPAKANLFDGTGVENIGMSSDQNQETNYWFCDSFRQQQTIKMSGGEQQRINIGRGLNRRASLILADEPTSNLDPETSYRVMQDIIKEAETCVIVTHDKSLLNLFTRVIDMGRKL